MTRESIAAVAARMMRESGKSLIWDGDLNFCHEVYFKATGRKCINSAAHTPKRVIDAVRKSDLFQRAGSIRAVSRCGRREVKHPTFRLQEPEA